MAVYVKSYEGSDNVLPIRYCFSGYHFSDLQFLPLYLLTVKFLFSVGAGQKYFWKAWNAGGDGVRIIVVYLPPFLFRSRK